MYEGRAHRPPHFPKACWNWRKGRPKFQYKTVEEAKKSLVDFSMHVYYCKHCTFFHHGHPSKHQSKEVGRHEDLVSEIGIRATIHLLSTDTPSAIADRFRAAHRLQSKV